MDERTRQRVKHLQRQLGIAIDWANACKHHADHTDDAEVREGSARMARIAYDEARACNAELRNIAEDEARRRGFA